MNPKVRIIAFYLPQYHPIPENDTWWGKGFTEWTNVAKAKRMFRNHYQPRIPADLGFYDLRVPEIREAQAMMAKNHGIEGFCYWHYWFGNGKRLLEKPFNEILKSKKPDLPFCLAWANESWKGFEHGVNGRNVLIEQKYPGKEDYTSHFYEILPAFQDNRYIKINNKPIFYIYKPFQIPSAKEFIDVWQNLAIKNGLKGLYFVSQTLETGKTQELLDVGFNAVNTNRFAEIFKKRSLKNRLMSKMFRWPGVFEYKKVIKQLNSEEETRETVFPTIVPNWDHTPRSGRMGSVFHNSTPELFKSHVIDTIKLVEHKEHKIIFLKSWNEWAEGNYMEPDLKFSTQYLEVLKSVIF